MRPSSFIRRACCNPQPDDDSDSENTEGAPSKGGFRTAHPSPAIFPALPTDAAVSLLVLDGRRSAEECEQGGGMMLQARKMLEHARSLPDGGLLDHPLSAGYSTADEAATHEEFSGVEPEPLGISEALVLACERR